MVDETNKDNWVVNSRDSWDDLWSRSIPVYWTDWEKNPNEAISLYSIYKKMGVNNIRPLGDANGVVFCGGDERGPEIVKVTPLLTTNVKYEGGEWQGLASAFSVKLPNSLQVSKKTIDSFGDFNSEIDVTRELNAVLANSNSLISAPVVENASDFLSKSIVNSDQKICTVRIPELLILLGAIDRYLSPKSPLREQFIALDREISNGLTVLLSQWIELGRFFPFGFIMSQNDSRIRPPYDIPESQTNVKSGYQSAPTASNEVNTTSRFGTPAEQSTTLNNRGGSEGLDDDYDWEHFAPKMVAYNWQRLRELKSGLKNGDSLREYPEMLAQLDYAIPDFTDIFVNLENTLPWLGNKLGWNYAGFASDLVVEYPVPPKNFIERPMALCDLIADRANEPFTSF